MNFFSLDTLKALQDERPQEIHWPLSDAVRNFEPECPLRLDKDAFTNCLKTSPRGSAPGPGGCRFGPLAGGLAGLLNYYAPCGPWRIRGIPVSHQVILSVHVTWVIHTKLDASAF